MKTCVNLLFLLLAINGAWATFPLPYIQLGLLPPPYDYIHQPPERFGGQPPFFLHPQFRRDFVDIYQPPRFTQPENYNYYEFPQVPRYPSYPEYIPTPEHSHNRVVQYFYQQTPQHPIPSSLDEPMKSVEPVPTVFNKATEVGELEKVTKPKETTDDSISDEATTNSINSESKPESTEVTETTNPTEPTKPTEPKEPMESTMLTQHEEAEDTTAQSTEATTPLTEETPTTPTNNACNFCEMFKKLRSGVPKL